MKLKDVLSPFTAWKNLFVEPVVIKDPFNDRPGAERYRGFHKNDLDKCIGCGSCEEICENEAIDLRPVEGIETKHGDSGLRPLVDYGRCCWCALCVDICTTNSLTMSNEYTWVTEDPDDFLYFPGVDKKPWDNNELGWKKPAPDYSLIGDDRIDIDEHDPDDRIKSFIEIVKGYDLEQGQKEADRCVECGICISTCPAHMDIPGYIRAARENNFEEGLKILYDTNPLPEICGRVCTHRCEEVCSVGHTGEPLAIRWIKRYISSNVPFEKYKEILGVENIQKNGKTVGVIGAGPAGISVAYYLAIEGFDVTIYEGKNKPGGMTMYGIPKYRLPMEILDKEIGFLQEIGVTFKFNTFVGKDITFDELYKKHDASFIAIGFEDPYKIGIEGENKESSIQAIDFLRDINDGLTVDVGKSVAIIGGGNVAFDAARVARRLDAEVTILYRRRIVDMPADEEEILGAEEEKVNIVAQTMPIEIISKDNKVTGIKYLLTEMIPPEKEGDRPKPKPIDGSDTILEIDTLIGAIGQSAVYDFMGEYKEKLDTKWGRMLVNDGMETSIPKLFAGGDAVNNTADAISAIKDGHKAAYSIQKLLLDR